MPIITISTYSGITISTYSGRTQREKDSLAEAITEDVEQNTVFNPEETNITRGEEYLYAITAVHLRVLQVVLDQTIHSQEDYSIQE